MDAFFPLLVRPLVSQLDEHQKCTETLPQCLQTGTFVTFLCESMQILKSSKGIFRNAVLTLNLSISLSISLIEIVLVSIDKKASECAVCPERVKEETVLLGIEDLQPDLV